MVFEIKGKVALITGAAGGIGAACAKELLRNGLRGVTLADVDANKGQKLVNEIENEFGTNKAIFVKTDVTKMLDFENAFKETIAKFANVDILMNNAGILDDKNWEKVIPVNINGVVHGMLLGLDNYIQKYKSGPEGVIVNTSSNTGVEGHGNIPIYCGTKFAVHGMTRAWGIPFHYERTKVKVLAICPGPTDSLMLENMSKCTLGEPYQRLCEEKAGQPVQSAEECARATVEVIRNGSSGSVWVIKDGQPPYEYIMPPLK